MYYIIINVKNQVVEYGFLHNPVKFHTILRCIFATDDHRRQKTNNRPHIQKVGAVIKDWICYIPSFASIINRTPSRKPPKNGQKRLKKRSIFVWEHQAVGSNPATPTEKICR